MIRLLISLCCTVFTTLVHALPAEHAGATLSHGELTRVITGLLLVLIIIIALSWLIKRLNLVNLRSSQGFELIASMILGPKEKIMLMKVGEQYLLMGVAGGSISMLYDYGKALPSGFSVENKPGFAELLKSAIGKPK